MSTDSSFFQRQRKSKDILAYLHLLNNPKDEVALLRIINTPTRGIGKTTLKRLADYATEHGLALWECGSVRTADSSIVCVPPPRLPGCRTIETVDSGHRQPDRGNSGLGS